MDAFFQSAREIAAAGAGGFVSLDEGLAIMSKHARALGYDAIVLFLDELILWLASHAADVAFINREGQKVAKLVEAMTAERPIPIVSFIARQRDLRELVGEHLPGAEQLGFADVLTWWEARFDAITLEDRNLPVIAEKRLLRPMSPQAAQLLQEAFDKTARVREEVMNILLTRAGDRHMFRQVYPFSPALVQTLVAISSLLQRERTALKLMLQLLVNQRDSLELGDIVPVGDLFDVIVEGDEPFAQAMRLNFDNAKKLYRQKLLPMLEQEHSVTAQDVTEGRVDATLAMRFRNDDRLLKTLLLSALAPEVEALRALTPSRLAALNHGTVRSPIPGQESPIVLNKCRRWAAQVGEIKISEDERNPVISLHIVGIDTEGILANAQGVDNYGNRRAAQVRDGRIEVERPSRDEVRRIAVPLRLGDMGETHFVLRDEWKSRFLRKQAEEGLTHINVRRLRVWMDQPAPMGLPTEIQNLVILSFARQSDLSFSLHGRPVEATLDRLDDELELREQVLPGEEMWKTAAQRVQTILRIPLSPLLSAANVATLVADVTATAERHRPEATRL